MNIIKKDITTIDEGVILHQVNCQNAMESGVAKALFTKWPQIKTEYHKAFEKLSKDRLYGQIQRIVINENIIVLNSFSQYNYGRDKKVYTNMKYLKENIYKAYKYAKSRNQKLYIPEFVGCGLAGGNWEELMKELKYYDNTLVICSIT